MPGPDETPPSVHQPTDAFVRSILDSVVEGIVVSDASGNFLLWNTAATQILCAGPISAPPSEWSRYYGLHADEQSPALPQDQLPLVRALRGEQVDNMRLFVRHLEVPQGVWITLNARPLRDEAGRITAAVAVFRDETQALRAEAVQQRQALVFETITDAVMLLDMDGRIIDWNRAAENLYGYTRQEMLGRRPDVLDPPEVAEPVHQGIFEIVRSTGRWTGELAFVTRAGRRGITETTCVPMVDHAGRAVAIVGVNHDVTQKHANQLALRRIELAVQQIEEGVIITDAQLASPGPTIIFVNEGFTRLTGYSSQEAVGRSPRLLQGKLTDRKTLRQMRAALEAGHAFHGEIVNHRKNGTTYLAEMDISPVRDSVGRIVNWVAIQRDRTAHRAAEEHARQRHEQLAHVSRLHAIGETASNLAHELNQPLAAITNNAFVCAQRLEAGDNPEQAVSLLHSICEQAQRAGEIIRHLRHLVRRTERSVRPILVHPLIESCLTLREPRIKAASILLQKDFADAQLVVPADPIELEQVLLHLIDNAIDAMLDQTAERVLTIRTRLHEALLSIEVEDTGHSLTPDRLTGLFVPFQSKKADGLGIGLAVSRSIIEAHSGHLEASLTPAGGARLHVTLPCA